MPFDPTDTAASGSLLRSVTHGCNSGENATSANGARLRRWLPLLMPILLLWSLPNRCLAAQGPAPAEASTSVEYSDGLLGSPVALEGNRSVKISLEERRLYVLEGDEVVWSAEIGVGTGETLEGAGQYWDFSTPQGRFSVQYKELDPVWFLPDWVFVKRGEPLPPSDSPERREEGELGAAALYLTREIAIHGTDQPELLGDAISHGCIRMSNDDVLRLYEELEVGTPVIIQ